MHSMLHDSQRVGQILCAMNCIFDVSTLFVICDLYCREEGRHAGPGGDIEQIVAGAKEKRPDLSIRTTAVPAGQSAS